MPLLAAAAAAAGLGTPRSILVVRIGGGVVVGGRVVTYRRKKHQTADRREGRRCWDRASVTRFGAVIFYVRPSLATLAAGNKEGRGLVG